MNKIIYPIIGFLVLFAAGCDAAPQWTGKYIFDKEDHKQNIDTYTLGKKTTEAKIACKTSSIFS